MNVIIQNYAEISSLSRPNEFGFVNYTFGMIEFVFKINC